MSAITQTRLQAIKDVFRKLLASGNRAADPSFTKLAKELKEVFPPVTFGTGAPTSAPGIAAIGDLYCDRSTGQFYQYTTGGWLVLAGGGGGSYILPIASDTILGGVKVGSGLAIDGSGVLSSTGGLAQVDIEDDTVPQGGATTLDFGTGLTVTVALGKATITASPGISSIPVQEDGVAEGNVTTLNIGSGLNLAVAGNLGTITAEGYVQVDALTAVSGNYTYVGQATPGSSLAAAVWRIRRIETVAGVYTVLKADGNDNFDNIWNNYASLSYS